MFKRGTGSIFRRLFVLFLALVVVVYGSVTALFINYVLSQRKIQEDRVAGQLGTSTSVISQQLKAANSVMTQLFNDSRLAKLALGIYTDLYDRSELALDIISSIQSTRDLSGLINDIIIAFPAENMELSASMGYRRCSYTHEDFVLDRSEAGDALRMVDNRLELRIASPLRVSLEENYIPDYEIRLRLSSDYLNSYLDSMRTGGEGAFWVLRRQAGDLLLFSTAQRQEELLTAWGKSGADTVTLPGGEEYLVASSDVSSFNLTLVSYRSALSQAWQLGTEIFYIALVVLVMGALFGMMILWANRSVNKPLRKIMAAFEQLRSGDLTVRIFHSKGDEFDYIYDSFNAAAGRLEQQVHSLKEQQNLLERAEVIQLQSQINPHFLYNSFYNIKFLAHNEEYEQIETLVTALARYYRFLNKQTSLAISLSEEAAHMANYIEIQQMRFGDKITVDIQEVPREAALFKVPKLILQPVVENAYAYGLVSLLEGGILRVRYEVEGDFLHIRIADNGNVMNPVVLQKLRRQIGTFDGEAVNHALTNINRRLILAYGEGCGVRLGISGLGGLEVELVLNMTVNI